MNLRYIALLGLLILATLGGAVGFDSSCPITPTPSHTSQPSYTPTQSPSQTPTAPPTYTSVPSQTPTLPPTSTPEPSITPTSTPEKVIITLTKARITNTAPPPPASLTPSPSPTKTKPPTRITVTPDPSPTPPTITPERLPPAGRERGGFYDLGVPVLIMLVGGLLILLGYEIKKYK